MTDVYVWYLTRRHLEEVRRKAGLRSVAVGREPEPAFPWLLLRAGRHRGARPATRVRRPAPAAPSCCASLP